MDKIGMDGGSTNSLAGFGFMHDGRVDTLTRFLTDGFPASFDATNLQKTSDVIAFLLTRFETTLPVEIWSLMRSGLNPKTNAVGSLVFGVSIVLAIVFELTVMRKRRI